MATRATTLWTVETRDRAPVIETLVGSTCGGPMLKPSGTCPRSIETGRVWVTTGSRKTLTTLGW